MVNVELPESKPMNMPLVPIVIGCFILAGIGTIMLASILSTGSDVHVETFSVTNPSIDRSCTVTNDLGNTLLVEYQNSSGNYHTLNRGTDYTVSGKTITVLAVAMD